MRLVRGDRDVFGVHGRSAEQRVAIELLLDPEVGIVSLGGRAGTGKSALALCAGLESVLERRAHLKVSEADVYVSTVGGIRLSEPAADLAIALAVASALRDKPMPGTLAAVGEISLAGEIRPVTAARLRAAEARRLGFSDLLDGESGDLAAVIATAFAAGATASADRPAF